MLRYRARGARRRRRALPVADASSMLDGLLFRARRPLVLTAHDILPREPRPGQRAAQRRLYEHFDAVVVHSEHGRAAPDGRARGRSPRACT